MDDNLYTTKLQVTTADSYNIIPTYRVMDTTGKVYNKDNDPEWDKPTCQKFYTYMVRLSIMDTILNDVQRQGRISFYMTAKGEEAIHFGCASALSIEDVIFAQYREQGILMYRGFNMEQMMNQCYSNRLDLGKGRQMPVHYGSKELNFQTISSPLGTQIPQASGAAYALKMAKKDAIVVCFFGEGAASEGDFHAGVNFAATREAPVMFFCRNNGFAISTPANEQFKGDGLASRAHGYGIDTIRFDGNDIFAVHECTKLAREMILKTKRPMLLEAMTYRVGHHSTSDDSSRYRLQSEIDYWLANNNPITRLKGYMEDRGFWDESMEEKLREEVRKEVLSTLALCEKQKKPAIEEIFTDVYHDIPEHLLEQQEELSKHLQKYGHKYYNLDEYYGGEKWEK